jgi:DNA polymerase III gamma/tau subunit
MECPPAKRVIVLTTTESEWCDETLFSRFYTIPLVKPHSDAIVQHLASVAERERLSMADLNLKRFVQDRHNNIRLCLNDLEIEAAIAAAA